MVPIKKDKKDKKDKRYKKEKDGNEDDIKSNKINENENIVVKNKMNTMIPNFSQTALFKTNKYTIFQLKEICRHYKIKCSGNKEQLIEIIYNFLERSRVALIIQKSWKKYCVKVYNVLHGPARKNRSICVNETDFYTMDSLSLISYEQFFSFRDKDNMIYGFDILSLYNLFNKNEKMNGTITTNPYNRSPISATTRSNIDRLIKFSKFIGHELTIKIEEPYIDPSRILNTQIKSLFNEMDSLGNYTDSNWFLSLNQLHLVQFIKELFDIWNYRAHLTHIVKTEICPPYGNPFQGINLFVLSNMPIDALKKIALVIMEPMVRSGINRESKCLGSNYVLCALTLVNPQASNALPWLYHSVSPI